MPVEKPPDTALVIDDAPETLSLVSDVLEDAGMTALVASNASEAFAIIARVTPDVILLDAVMPGMDGFDTCRQLKRMPEVADVPVIFMTGLTEPEHVVRGFQAGGIDYVTKPIAPEVLVARVRTHVAAARTAQSARAALDSSGRHLLTVERTGRIVWATPEAARLTAKVAAAPEGGLNTIPDDIVTWLATADIGAALDRPFAGSPPGAAGLRIVYVGTDGRNQRLLRLSEADLSESQRLQRRFALTSREVEVLLWIARGKANRDIAEILGLSPRTVNKHLEQVFAKLGVENRTAAAAVALECLSGDR